MHQNQCYMIGANLSLILFYHPDNFQQRAKKNKKCPGKEVRFSVVLLRRGRHYFGSRIKVLLLQHKLSL